MGGQILRKLSFFICLAWLGQAGPGATDVSGQVLDAIGQAAAAIMSGRFISIGPDVIGAARVIDGDTVEIDRQRIRLFAIDSPEADQPCHLEDDVLWYCGDDAAAALRKRINGRVVRCRPYDTDKFQRLVAICYVGADDLNRWMVRHGWATAFEQYSKKYVGDQQKAEKEKAGIWISSFEPPWIWRRDNP